MAETTDTRDEKKRQPIYAGVGLILGSAVGFAIGGPVGGALGAAVGLILGAGLDAQKKKTAPPDEKEG